MTTDAKNLTLDLDVGAHPGKTVAAHKAEAKAGAQGAQRIPALDTKLRVADVMTREVRTLGPNDQLRLAEELMQQGRFRHVLVVDAGRVVGVLSQRDIFHGALAWSLGQGRKAHEQLLAATAVKDVMGSHVVTVDPEAPLAEAAAHQDHGADLGERAPEPGQQHGQQREASLEEQRRHRAQPARAERAQLLAVLLPEVLGGLAGERRDEGQQQHGLCDHHGAGREEQAERARARQHQEDAEADHHGRQVQQRIQGCDHEAP
jgi:CBS domain-containing protein